MKLLEIDNIIDLLGADTPEIHEPGTDARHAAVAAILRPGKDHTEALFILRSVKVGDPWSGQMAFPGGHYEQHDNCLRETAERETFEEIGLDLKKDARYIGKVADVDVNPRGRNINMIVSPFVFVLENQNPSINMNYEVADVLWGSLNDMYTGSSLTEQDFSISGKKERFPGYSVGDQVVWGLTMRMLDNIFEKLDPNWQGRYE
jgi:8-oxo-dGTP pyrophosphatase MutT (NUDIX family)